MKRFLTLVLWLITIPFLLLFASESIERYVWKTVCNENDSAICVGDSHAQPIKLDSGPTIAKGGDPFLISYLTVKRLLGLHHAIHDVYLSVGPQSFSSLPESRLREYFEGWFSASGERICKRMSLTDYLNLDQFSAPVLQHFGFEFSITSKGIMSSKPVNWGGAFRPNAEERAENHRIKNSNWFKGTGLQAKQLTKLIDLCEDKNVNLYLVGTPIHSSYRAQIESTSWEIYKTFLDSLVATNSHCYYLSFEEEDWPDSLYFDSDHLNSMGGELLGKRLETITHALQLP